MAHSSLLSELSTSDRARGHTALRSQINVIRALLLRDIRTRFFGHGLGYLLAIAWPVAHIAILLMIYSFTGRMAPYGASTALWFATGLVPVMAFIYASRFIMMSVVMNQPLLGLPIVKVTDIMLARSILEAAAAFCMAGVIMFILWMMHISVMPHDTVAAACALVSSIILGIGFGVVNAVLARLAPLWLTGYTLFTIVFYITSGVLFVPDALPDLARQVLSWNPALHGSEWMRMAYYEGYSSRTLDKTYLIGSGVVSLFLGLACERLIRGRLLQG